MGKPDRAREQGSERSQLGEGGLQVFGMSRYALCFDPM